MKLERNVPIPIGIDSTPTSFATFLTRIVITLTSFVIFLARLR